MIRKLHADSKRKKAHVLLLHGTCSGKPKDTGFADGRALALLYEICVTETPSHDELYYYESL